MLLYMEGGCYCGEVRFKVEGPPTWVGACHCVDCRKVSGAPYTVWVGYKNRDFNIVKGAPEKFASSEKAARSFCGRYHSPVAFIYTDPNVTEEDDLTYIALGTLDDSTDIKLIEHIWVSQKLPWVDISDGLPHRSQ